MKYLRVTMWFGKNAAPMTTLIPETDLRVGVYAAATAQRTVAQGDSVLGFTEIEVHEFPDDVSFEEVVLRVAAVRRTPAPPRERHMNTMYDWGMSLLEQLNPGGIAQTTQPAPLSVADLTEVLEAISAAPNYRQQVFRMTADDNTAVTLVNGKVVTGENK